MAQDTFTEASDTALTSHTPESGGTWSIGSGTWTVNAANDWLVISAGTLDYAWLSTNESSANCWTEITGKSGGTGPGYRLGAMCRGTGFARNNASSNAYLYWFNGDGLDFLWKEVAGSRTELATGTISGFSAATDYAVKVEADGTSIRGYLNSTAKLGPITDSAITAAGKPQVYLSDSAGSTTTITLLNSGVLSSGTTGTIAVTLAAFTTVFTGTTTILGTISNTLSAFISSIIGNTTIVGTIANTLSSFVSSITGSVGDAISGTISSILDSFTSVFTATTTIVGTISNTLNSFIASLQGTTTIIGTIANTLGDFVSNFVETVSQIISRGMLMFRKMTRRGR